MPENGLNTQLENQIRECFGRVVYSHKTHLKMADRCAARMAQYKVAQIAVTALTSSGAVGVVVFDDFRLKLATALLSFLSLFIAAYLKNFDPGGTAQKHRDTASKLWGIRESYFSLITDLPEMELADARTKRDELQELLERIYASEPQTDGKAFAAAQDALKNNEELTFCADEINCFLPASHRKSE
ncbi:SLATT domain-containing protein [uncultured Tateyamaria sp.]|uniref:SLATT domain-containing protein n=1 Tax=uncultured Tateyamaria sp. TaxID=455651 RepID=UPI0026189285|nr:SLATT domain-containing protein [uncultured Tateyamaria sp.]